jgi:hypothetical protein
MSDDGFEGLENVRACCDGRHTVGHSGKHHHHHHHTHPHNQGTLTSRKSADNQHLDPNPPDHARPASPAWSFRSRTGSAQSHEGAGAGGIFSWGRGDDGKLRFGSRRSAKTSVPAHDYVTHHHRNLSNSLAFSHLFWIDINVVSYFFRFSFLFLSLSVVTPGLFPTVSSLL